MKLRYLLCYTVCATTLLSGCQTELPYFKSTKTPPFHKTKTELQTPPKSTAVDEAIISELLMLDKREIAIAAQAEKKATRPSTQKLAQRLLKHHRTHLKKTLILSQKLNLPPKDQYRAMRIKQEWDNEEEHLEKAAHSEFDRLFISSVIHNHKCALSLIKDNLRTVTNPVLKAHLMATYPPEEKELEDAERHAIN